MCPATTVVCSLSHIHDPLVETMARTTRICFGDCLINSTICEWLLRVDVTAFITIRCPRRIHHSWKQTTIPITHSSIRGVTDYHSKVYIFHRKDLSLLPIWLFPHQRDAHTILDDSVWCHVKRRKPLILSLTPLRIINVRSVMYPV